MKLREATTKVRIRATLACTVALALGCGDAPKAASRDVEVLREAVLAVLGDDAATGVVAGLQGQGGPAGFVTAGRADRETGRPVAIDDEMRIGSVTKSFTVTALLQLVDEGSVDLDTPIREFLPGLQNGGAALRQLANMTSGIFNYTEDRAFQQELVGDLTRTWTAEELLAAADRNQPYFPPGAGWTYSNTNTVALGLVVEHVTGQSLAAEIRRRIVEPLGLGGTVYPETVDLPDPFAHGYARFDPAEPLADVTASSPTSSAGSGALVSRAADLLVWVRALGTGALLSPETHAEQLRMVPSRCEGCPEYDEYGLGIGRISGWIGHTGDFIGYQALALYDVESRTAVAIVTNLRDFTRREHVPQRMFLEFLRRRGR